MEQRYESQSNYKTKSSYNRPQYVRCSKSIGKLMSRSMTPWHPIYLIVALQLTLLSRDLHIDHRRANLESLMHFLSHSYHV